MNFLSLFFYYFLVKKIWHALIQAIFLNFFLSNLGVDKSRVSFAYPTAFWSKRKNISSFFRAVYNPNKRGLIFSSRMSLSTVIFLLFSYYYFFIYIFFFHWKSPMAFSRSLVTRGFSLSKKLKNIIYMCI